MTTCEKCGCYMHWLPPMPQEGVYGYWFCPCCKHAQSEQQDNSKSDDPDGKP